MTELTSMGQEDIDNSRVAMSNGQMEGRATTEVSSGVKLDTGFDELSGLAAKGRGGGGRTEIGEGGRV